MQAELFAREVAHRCANDLQLVVSLLELQSRRAVNLEARQALREAANRVAVLAGARAFSRDRQHTLVSVLQQVCAALNSQIEPQAILVTLCVAADTDGLSEALITNAALSVNELATNAVKHAFRDGNGGRIDISVERGPDGYLTIAVEDDGQPIVAKGDGERVGLGLDLVRNLLASIGATLRIPAAGSKRFEIQLALSRPVLTQPVACPAVKTAN